jgi:hypothetical protein
MRHRILTIVGGLLLLAAGYVAGSARPSVAYAQTPTQGGIPKSYGHLAAAVVNPNGTGLVFEDSSGVIRLVTMTGQLEGELTRN